MKRTYWLYYGNRCLTAVRLSENSTDEQVRQHALEQHEKHPTIGSNLPWEAPCEFRWMLERCHVRRYE